MDEGASEPTLRDVLAAIGEVARAQGDHSTALREVRETLDGLKLDFAGRAELEESRHTEVTQALEAIAGLVHQQQHALAQSEARISSRIGDVQAVVQAVKADLAAHSSDTQIHRSGHGQVA